MRKNSAQPEMSVSVKDTFRVCPIQFRTSPIQNIPGSEEVSVSLVSKYL